MTTPSQSNAVGTGPAGEGHESGILVDDTPTTPVAERFAALEARMQGQEAELQTLKVIVAEQQARRATAKEANVSSGRGMTTMVTTGRLNFNPRPGCSRSRALALHRF